MFFNSQQIPNNSSVTQFLHFFFGLPIGHRPPTLTFSTSLNTPPSALLTCPNHLSLLFLMSRRLQELLSKEELGGEKPTDLLRRMKKLLGNKYTSFDKELFLQLFYQRLPPDTQRCLFTVKNKLSVDELATLADEFMATFPQASTSGA
ncbi:hypothetical protein O3P69_009017 [Scylla paramamosain]|uniref:Uncharacterized protein n=1 Tax=Scylla paramamosain TaxID=85552 RepID=A0AAW0TQA7_SCYPA